MSTYKCWGFVPQERLKLNAHNTVCLAELDNQNLLFTIVQFLGPVTQKDK